MVASKQQQRVALVLLITCLDNKKKKRRWHVWSKSWLGKRRLYGLPVLQRELEVILLFEFKHPISLQAASFKPCHATTRHTSTPFPSIAQYVFLPVVLSTWLVSTFSWFEVVALIASSGSAHLLVLGLTVVVGDVTLQESVWNLLTLPEFNRRKKLIATAINRLSVDMSNQRSKTTDFSLGLQESFRIFKICLRRPNRGQNRTVWAGLYFEFAIRNQIHCWTIINHF